LVKAPFAGVLGFRQVSEGTLLTATTPITTLDDISIIKLDFSVPEVHLGKVEVGQEVLAHSSAHPERAFPAEVQTIGSRVDPITRAATIRAHVPNPDGLLRPGMLLRVSLVINREEVPMVPETALRQRGGEVFVFLVEEGFTRMTPVRIGVRQAGWVHVLEGVELGESVISDGVIKVRDNVPVRIIDGEPAAHAAAGAR
ncbi:MAG: efflux RND transporter periplasmic adaptor subunit, partial [Pseudomonadales bacterium]